MKRLLGSVADILGMPALALSGGFRDDRNLTGAKRTWLSKISLTCGR